MQSAQAIINRVKLIVKDESFADVFILEKINDGLAEIALRTSPPDLVVRDVELEVSPDESLVLMPHDFFGPRLYSVKNATDDILCKVFYRLSEFSNFVDFYKKNTLNAVCLKGKTLHLSCLPGKPVILHVSYQKTPIFFENVADSGDAILYLPERIGESAVVNYAAMQLFFVIEDGIDGKSVNTSKALSLYEQDISRLLSFFGIEATESSPETILQGMSFHRATGFGYGQGGM